MLTANKISCVYRTQEKISTVMFSIPETMNVNKAPTDWIQTTTTKSSLRWVGCNALYLPASRLIFRFHSNKPLPLSTQQTLMSLILQRFISHATFLYYSILFSIQKHLRGCDSNGKDQMMNKMFHYQCFCRARLVWIYLDLTVAFTLLLRPNGQLLAALLL